MNWYLVASLSSLGLVMGALSVRGLTHRIEPFLWLALGLFAAIAIAKNVGPRWFLHAVLVGVVWGALNGAVQSALFEVYAANNAAAISAFANRPSSIPPRLFFLLTGPLIGGATGVVLGGLTFLIRQVVGPPS